ncbi:MAG: hypothetical protein PF485_02215, partial [Bacteroidales bacterium]|nr:hypothetical protein [Bacteroidales bacterium]
RYKFYEAIEHDPPMINEQSGNKLFELLILEKDVINFEKYLFPPKYHTFEVSKVNEGLEDAIDDGEAYKPTGAACNICIRASLYHIANDNVLFPYKLSSPIGGANSTTYKGKISGVGRANNIYIEMAKWQNSSLYGQLNTSEDKLKEDDFNEWVSWDTTETIQQTNINLGKEYLVNNSQSVTEFEHILKDVTITIDNLDYQVPNFNELQTNANDGVLIIGVRKNSETYSNGNYKSGHIVIISPYVEGSENEEGRKDYQTTTGVKIYFPRTVECGNDDKILGWLSKNFAKDMEWYRYK